MVRPAKGHMSVLERLKAHCGAWLQTGSRGKDRRYPPQRQKPTMTMGIPIFQGWIHRRDSYVIAEANHINNDFHLSD